MGLPMNRSEIFEAINVGRENEVDAALLRSEFMKLCEEWNVMADTIKSLADSCSKAKVVIDQLMQENAKLSMALQEAVRKNIRGN